MESFNEDKSAACVITLKSRGPLAITGDFVIIDEAGNEIPKKEKISICRCGMSKTLPICDGAHKGLSFGL